MCTQRPRVVVALLTALILLLCSSHALAGIIVTEGKISRCTLSLTSLQALWDLGIWPDEQEGCTPSGETTERDESDEDAGHDFDEEDEDLDLEEGDLSDLDSTPDGYACSDLGNGLELCEDAADSSADSGDDNSDDSADDSAEEDGNDGQGAGAGSAIGGMWSAVAYSNEDSAEHSEESVAGCQAGGQLGDSLLVALSILLGLAVTRRRREGVDAR
jgi:MYXO-CTERM domain-containing protein